MFLWAVSLTVQIPSELRSSVVTLLRDGRPSGQAVMVDEGLFLASGTSDGSVQALTGDNRTVTLRRVAFDGLTQLALLRGNVPGIPLRVISPNQSGPVMVVGTHGVQRGQLVSTNRLGVVGTKRRYAPLSEVRIAGQISDLKDAVFFLDRSVAGFLVSVVDAPLVPSQQAMNAVPFGSNLNYGPAPMSVAYLTGPDAMQRLLQTYRAGESKVSYPYLGVMCRDARGIGAEVVSVTANSAASAAGIQSGDVIVNISGTIIKDQFDFAQTLYRLKAGDRAVVTIKRGDHTVIVAPTLGRSED